MSYTRLHDPTSSSYPPSMTSNAPPPEPRTFLTKIPQFNPRELKSAKIPRDRKRKLLLSYLPDW